MVRIAIDIGGAFTDIYASDLETSREEWIKVESTPPNFEKGVIKGLNELERRGIFMKDVSQIIHGQTVVINTIITRSGGNVGFITTAGYNILEIQRANRRDIFNFKYKKPTPFVSRDMTEWIDERIDVDKSSYKPLIEEDVRQATMSLFKKGAEAIAIGFINSYINPLHEIKAKAIAEQTLRECGIKTPLVTISSDLSREWREYERFNTAVLNAYVHPVFISYLEKIESDLKRRGFNGVFYLTLASGGMVVSDYAKRFPIFTIEGGPISGFMGGIMLSEILQKNNIIVIDGGSTTTKAGLAKDLRPQISTDYWVEQDDWNAGYPIRVPTLNINEIGTGGTSIVWVDEARNLQVGPQAVGSRPGPACYGMGGDKPTLTDAYLVTGYLNPNYLLGGKLKIHKKLAEEVFATVANKLDIGIKEAAYGAIMLANENSSNLIRQISMRRGFDPREFVLIAHGGSGPMVAPFIAKDLGISQIVIPSIQSGVFNSWGMLGLDIKHQLVQTNTILVKKAENVLKILNSTFKDLECKIKAAFESENIDPSSVEMQRHLDMQYEGQAHTMKVASPTGELNVEEIEDILKSFHDAHEREYGFSLVGSTVKIVNFDVMGLYKTKRLIIEEQVDQGSVEDAFLEKREVFDGVGDMVVPVYKKEKLPSLVTLPGPSIIETDTSTIIITQSFKAVMDQYKDLIIKQKLIGDMSSSKNQKNC